MEDSGWLSLLNEIADRADEIALRFFRSAYLAVELKSDQSPVTIADRTIEEAARALLRARRPSAGILGEEHGETASSCGARLIIDPIDGTANYARGIPLFATLLAVEEDGEIAAGLVSAPALNSRWWASRGGGAYRDGVRIRVSGIQSLEEAQVFHAGVLGPDGRPLPPGILRLLGRAARTRGFGDFYQHLLVAEGSGEIAVDPIVRPWDVAALTVIVEEAGGKATTFEGERAISGGSLLTSNGWLHAEAMERLRSGADGGSPID